MAPSSGCCWRRCLASQLPRSGSGMPLGIPLLWVWFALLPRLGAAIGALSMQHHQAADDAFHRVAFVGLDPARARQRDGHKHRGQERGGLDRQEEHARRAAQILVDSVAAAPIVHWRGRRNSSSGELKSSKFPEQTQALVERPSSDEILLQVQGAVTSKSSGTSGVSPNEVGATVVFIMILVLLFVFIQPAGDDKEEKEPREGQQRAPPQGTSAEATPAAEVREVAEAVPRGMPQAAPAEAPLPPEGQPPAESQSPQPAGGEEQPATAAAPPEAPPAAPPAAPPVAPPAEDAGLPVRPAEAQPAEPAAGALLAPPAPASGGEEESGSQSNTEGESDEQKRLRAQRSKRASQHSGHIVDEVCGKCGAKYEAPDEVFCTSCGNKRQIIRKGKSTNLMAPGQAQNAKRASIARRASLMKPPPQALFVSGSDKFDGEYRMLDLPPEQNLSGHPVWQRVGAEDYLFSSPKHRWIIGDADEAAEKFDTDTGNVASKNLHGVNVWPHESTEGWLRYDDEAASWSPLPGMKVTAPPPGST
eukprot:TRINITY_DN83891_c0_g1_i1.p1 TRINITY_DN83891_c0_g1~~TRINITY_DN83891_c0_g1_i1.p1  ORF type:complete len:532 (+),score=132.15 TRINITY_DN83891_c0_g1_i1:129-1724(+)